MKRPSARMGRALATVLLSCAQAVHHLHRFWGPQLNSWKETASNQAIVEFVRKVTTESSSEFVPVPERIAVVDNEGTLWSEKPVRFQVIFAFECVKALASQHPEWNTWQPFSSVLRGDMQGLAATGEKGVLEIIAATQ